MNLGKAMEIIKTFRDAWPAGSSQFAGIPHPLLYWIKWHLSRVKQRVASRHKPTSVDEQHPAWQGLDAMTRQLYRSTHETVLPTLLRNYDRYSMASGVEIRMPFLDDRLVTFAFALPWTSKLRNGYSKAIIRDAVAPFVPRDIAYRKTKIGFNSPVVDWMKGPMREFLLDTVARRSFYECNLINAVETRQAIHKVVESPGASFLDGERAWSLLAPYLWEHAVLKGAGAP
jgi:asparagine synthase (glutamine-hydrolysing)